MAEYRMKPGTVYNARFVNTATGEETPATSAVELSAAKGGGKTFRLDTLLNFEVRFELPPEAARILYWLIFRRSWERAVAQYRADHESRN